MNNAENIFADLDCGEFDAELTAPSTAAGAVNRETFPCVKCAGTGIATWGYLHTRRGSCYACKGKGHFLTSRQDRVRAQHNAKIRKDNKARDNWSAFIEAQPAAARWLSDNSTKSFAQSLTQAIKKYGSLTEKQLAAIHNIIVKDKEAKPASAPAAVLDLSAVFAKFEKAQESGLKRPKLRLEGVTFMLAGGRNVGSIYVKEGPAYEDTYLGKVAPNGEFTKSRDCSTEQVEMLKTISSDVLAAAVAYGRKTGECACCGKELTNHESIELGIGPICADKWGF